ncbi:hypothetical protein [Herbidospora daliensis]|uniref:hypothetical protein n=1 Tax=Herbidospora daliensis TaxID=295585 RepID=UPI000A9E996D|nr:hypothetical protein [Herbidospora daliensis]
MRLRSRVSRVLVAVVVAVAVVFVPAGPASAGIWQMTDSFEPGTNPASRWAWTQVGTCWGPTYQPSAQSPRTGSGMAYWEVLWNREWCSIGRRITLTPVLSRPGITCTAGVWAKLRGTAPQLNVEVIDPATFSYIALKSVPDPGWVDGWTFHSVTWTAQRADVLLRFAGLRMGTGPYTAAFHLDDVVVQCVY